MPWLRIDERFPQNRKIRRLTDPAFRLHVTALAMCAQDLTDGLVTREDLDEYPGVRPTAKVLAELVDRGLWDVDGDAWRIHDYLVYNPSKADVEAEREAARERQRRWKTRRKGAPPLDVEPPPADEDDPGNGSDDASVTALPTRLSHRR